MRLFVKRCGNIGHRGFEVQLTVDIQERTVDLIYVRFPCSKVGSKDDICICIYAYTYVCMYVYISMYVCMCVCVRIRLTSSIYIRLNSCSLRPHTQGA